MTSDIKYNFTRYFKLKLVFFSNLSYKNLKTWAILVNSPQILCELYSKFKFLYKRFNNIYSR
jgi:hypothetical protein